MDVILIMIELVLLAPLAHWDVIFKFTILFHFLLCKFHTMNSYEKYICDSHSCFQ